MASISLLVAALTHASAVAQGPCQFDSASLSFAGSPVEQAACLLRQVDPGGKVAASPTTLPPVLSERIGGPIAITRSLLHQYLAHLQLTQDAVGGSLDGDLSHAKDNASPVTAKYFVIHDTSSPNFGGMDHFPPNDASSLNLLAPYAGANAVAHVFVNRLGASLLGHDFRTPWRATKLESSEYIGLPAKGLFLHVELLQPRRSDPSGPAGNDVLAPVPGFTEAQYNRLALIYVAASSRAGTWLIPAFHAAIDEGIPDGHDDPQHFDLDAFARSLQSTLDALQQYATQ